MTMRITLRKAHALQEAIMEAVNSLPFSTTVELNEFEKPSTIIDEAQDLFIESESLRADLLDAYYNIRKNVALANVTAGVKELLAVIARTEKDIKFYSDLVKLDPATPLDVIVGKLGKIKEQPAESRRSIYGMSDSTVETTIFTNDDISEFKTKLSEAKKRKVQLKDQLLEANIKNEIELEPNVVAALEAADLI